MRRFKKILYVYDRETEKGAAFERAVNLATHNQALLTVVEVLQEISRSAPLASGLKEMREFKKIALEESTERLERLIATIKDKDIEVATKLLLGTDWFEIIREVVRNNHNLVMLSPRKKAKVQEMLFGSRIMHLMRKCPCPVWAIKPSRHKKNEPNSGGG
jgi:nucleotide-binding universal stress UspA family protein